MSLLEITHVTFANGEQAPLDELLCNNCGQEGCTHIAIWDDGCNAFCSWAHLVDSMRINGKPLTDELMREAGMQVIGPRPEA
jgi:hypothetical protein